MDLPENITLENLDEIIRRSALRLEQEQAHVDELAEGGAQHTSAMMLLAAGVTSLNKLKACRIRFT